MDRASGSGVFARDPDAMLDLIELDVTEALRRQEENKAVCATCKRYLDAHYAWQDELSQDDLCSQVQMQNYCKEHLSPMQMRELQNQISQSLAAVRVKTAWRIEGTLREFSRFEPVNLWFNYPVHQADDSGALKDINPEEETPSWKKAMDRRKAPEKRKKERKDSLENAYEACEINEKVTVQDLSEFMGVTEKTVRNRLKEHGGFRINEGVVERKKT